MIQTLRQKLRAILPPDLVRRIGWIRRDLFGWHERHWSQFGEDVLLGVLQESQPRGFFVDVGAHHPCRLSNTYLLYRRGWTGINIDPRPGVKRAFSRVRPRDLTIEIGISAKPATLTYYLFNEPACNTFSEAVARERDGKNGQRITGKLQIPTEPLSTLLDRLAPGRAIDFLSVDVEGMDLEVLKTLDFPRQAPRLLAIEIHGLDVQDLRASPSAAWLLDRGYRMEAWLGPTVFWRKTSP
ncbi:MAG: FkbM family methyltransferase [Spirochaetes bacterium]|nr:FkbM family methyltransferase [Spirochaetota bacterium]